MLRGVHILSKLLRGFKKTSSMQLYVYKILKTKTRCPEILKAQKQERIYKERFYRLQSNSQVTSQVWYGSFIYRF